MREQGDRLFEAGFKAVLALTLLGVVGAALYLLVSLVVFLVG